MSNEEQAQRESARDAASDGPGLQEDPSVVDPDDVVLDDGQVSLDTLEPELSVSPDALDLAEPALEPAQISTDTAAAASLEEAAAEARAVAAEAERTGTLVGGPMPADTPAVRASPDGTAPAGGVAGDVTQESRQTGDARDGSTAVGPTVDIGRAGGDGDVGPVGGPGGGPIGGPYAFPPEGGEPGLGHPGLYPGTDPAFIGPGDRAGDGAGPAGRGGTGADSGTPAASPDVQPESHGATAAWAPQASGGETGAAEGLPLRDRSRTKGSALPLLLVTGGVVVLVGLLIWLLVSLLGGTDEDRVDPSSLAAGECLAGFTDITEDAARVDCSEPHNAQLVASENYPDDAEFPGRDQLGLRAEAACATASSGIDPDLVGGDVQVTLLRATPTTETWAGGDRRVDCFAVVEDGGTLSRSLLGP
ncbi:septum formation family protein [Arthrobacter sp. B0490]|uniref:septum formation family protein n=1 Tax=Arthrobacter sp. B0490 TaxID=2058891 RepID=UPI000CE3EECE|nr:septum formation family protein [Arthrobacter sp. B0490]